MAMEPTDFGPEAREGNAVRLHAATADRYPDLPAVEMHGRTLTHAELHGRALRFAGGLHEHVDAGERVLVYLPNCPEYVVAGLGALAAGVPASPANPQYKPRELGYQLEDSDARAVVTHAALRERVTETLEGTGREPTVVTVGDAPDGDVPFEAVDGEPTVADVADDDVAVQPYTSGTTGRPKGALVTHDNLRAQAFAGLEFLDAEPAEDRMLAVLPLYHITGFVHCTWQPLVRGGSVHLRNPADWDAGEAMRTIEEHAISAFIGVSAMYVDVVNHDEFGEYDLSSLDVANEGGAKMPVAVQRRFEEVTGVDVAEGYGLTETTGATHTGNGSTFGARAGTVGQPLRMTEAKVVDDDGEEVPVGETGEILVRGPQVMKGYHGMPAANDEAFDDGWFRTGDVGRRDARNYYEVVDRKKHVIVTAGYNVYPSEVEALLYEHGAVAEAAVVGVPDERRGEVPKAYVVPAPGYEPGVDVTADDVRGFCLDNLAEYKHPREVEFVEELPRTASGKVQKFRLADGE